MLKSVSPDSEYSVPKTEPNKIPPMIQTTGTGTNKKGRIKCKQIKKSGASIPADSIKTNSKLIVSSMRILTPPLENLKQTGLSLFKHIQTYELL